MKWKVYNIKIATELVSKGFKVVNVEYNTCTNTLVHSFEMSVSFMVEFDNIQKRRLGTKYVYKGR